MDINTRREIVKVESAHKNYVLDHRFLKIVQLFEF